MRRVPTSIHARTAPSHPPTPHHPPHPPASRASRARSGARRAGRTRRAPCRSPRRGTAANLLKHAEPSSTSALLVLQLLHAPRLARPDPSITLGGPPRGGGRILRSARTLPASAALAARARRRRVWAAGLCSRARCGSPHAKHAQSRAQPGTLVFWVREALPAGWSIFSALVPLACCLPSCLEQ